MNDKIKITHEGQPCRKCNTPVIRKEQDSERLRIKAMNAKEGDYYYEYWFYCPNCKAMYMVNLAKRCYKDGDNYFLNVRISYSDEKSRFVAATSQYPDIKGFGVTKETALRSFMYEMGVHITSGMKL